MTPQTDAPGITSFTASQLVRVARLFATDASLASHLAETAADGGRRRVELAQTPHLQMWAITWPVGSTSGWHDHGQAEGAMVVVRGSLSEQFLRDGVIEERTYTVDDDRSFSAGFVHCASQVGSEPALTVHAYAPGLAGARSYDLVGGLLVEKAA